MLYLIAYDVSEDKKRNKIAQLLKGYGRRVEKSIFECDLTSYKHEKVVAYLRMIIIHPEDRCHIYPVCVNCAAKKIVIGEDIEMEWGEVVIV